MPKSTTSIGQDELFDFHGGIYPAEMKQQTRRIPSQSIPLATQLWLPLKQHLGDEGQLLVTVGEYVLKGQQLTEGQNRTLPIHAPTSGQITDITLHTTAHPSGLSARCLSLIPDGKEQWIKRKPIADYTSVNPTKLVEHIHSCGIAGLGGAGFPTATKLNTGLKKINLLIINAAECEPYITADDRLMQEHSDEIIQGCQILHYILQAKTVIIAIEDNKPEAIELFTHALKNIEHIILRVIPTKYPSGSAKQLTKIITGLEVPSGQHSATVGVLMQNVATVYAVKRAIINDEPLVKRIVTVTGDAIEQKGNFWVPFGTPIQHILDYCRYRPEPKQMVILGGPLTGFTLLHLDVPLIKTTNCILAPTTNEITQQKNEMACIRCTDCADVCPANLLPQQLYWFSQGGEHEKARNYHLFDCIECGACAYVCPSNIPLVDYYRKEKAEIRQLDQEKQQAQQAKERFIAKQIRLEREKLARQQSTVILHQSDQNKEAIQAALNRVKNKQQDITKQSTSRHLSINEYLLSDNETTIVAGKIHKIPAKTISINTGDDTDIDPRKAAVAAAIARAKQKNTQQLSINKKMTASEE